MNGNALFNKLSDDEFCQELNNLLYANCKKDVCIQTILEDHFKRSFSSIKQRYRRCTRKTIFSVHDEMLLKMAKELLKEKQCINVLNELGFRYESYFFKWFKKHTGLLPYEYKNSYEPDTVVQ